MDWCIAWFTVAIIWSTTVNLFLVIKAAEECQYKLTSTSGVLASPNFPRGYTNNQECTWNIKAPEGHYISLTFDVLDIEAYNGKCVDVVEVKDGATSNGELLGSYCEVNRPSHVLTSSSNHLRIWFYTDQSQTRRGFNASYTTHEETGCGNLTKAQSGTISSPRFGQHYYPSGISCEWIITRPLGEFIRLTFLYFGMEFKCWNTVCKCLDKLEIFDGPTKNATYIGSFCRFFQPPSIVSMTNRLRLVFTTNQEGRFIGFRSHFTTSITPGCGGDFTSPSGEFLSPNYPNSFPAFSHCIWRITAPDNHYISLRFTEFVGLNGTNPTCPFDRIQVLDGFTNKAPLIGHYCQEKKPSVLVSNGQNMFIQFRSQLINSLGRFKAFFMVHSKECTASLGVSDGRISDPQLTASSFFKQYIGNNNWRSFLPRFGRINTVNLIGPSWCSQKQSYSSTVGEYFQIDLRNVTNITAVATQGLYLDQYAHFVTMYKVEYSYDSSNWISYIGQNPNDTTKGYTEFTGNMNPFGVVHNTFKPTIIANMIRIIPTSYISPFRHICLKAEIFGCPYPQECGRSFSTMEPDEFSVRTTVKQGKKCSWLSVPGPSTIPGLILVLRFTYFDLPCNVGKVIIEERRSGDIKVICGSQIPPPFLTKVSEHVIVKIDAKAGAETVGFNIKSQSESLGCGEIMQVEEKEKAITSPDYPKPYLADQECSWILITTPGSQITLKFEAFDLEPKNGSECNDFVEVRDGQFKSSPVIDQFCGSEKPATIISTENYLYVAFKSNNKMEANGFRALHKRGIGRPTKLPKDASLVQDQDEKEKLNKAASMKETAIVYWIITVFFAASLG